MPAVTDGRALLDGVMVPLVTPMSRPCVPAAEEADALLSALATAGARSLMLFGSNGEGPLLPTSSLRGFARDVAARWRELTDGGPVLINVTAAGTLDAIARVEAVRPAAPDAVVLSPPIYYHHRGDEILAHFAALSDAGVPVVAYNAPKYSNPLTPPLIDALVAMPHVVGIKDSSGDLDLLTHIVAAARRRSDFGVSQGSERQLVAGLDLGADGIVPGIANIAPGLVVELFRGWRAARRADAAAAQSIVDQLLALHAVRPGVPSIKAVLAERRLCPPHVAPPLLPCTEAERRMLLDVLAPNEAHLARV